MNDQLHDLRTNHNRIVRVNAGSPCSTLVNVAVGIMKETHVSEERWYDCNTCKEPMPHYLYHNGNWVCIECGNEVKNG